MSLAASNTQRPRLIPATTPRRYVSFNRALNLRVPGELTGDWHFRPMFFQAADEPPKTIELAGECQRIDSTPTLGSHGVREMSAILARHGVASADTPVWVANHYRAMVDMALADVQSDRQLNGVLTARCINACLDTAEQVDTLVREYLTPLCGQLDKAQLADYNAWLRSIRWE